VTSLVGNDETKLAAFIHECLLIGVHAITVLHDPWCQKINHERACDCDCEFRFAYGGSR
jgi:hypothetical protein